MKLSIKRILVPVDFSELSLDALDGAVFIAKKLNAEIHILHVYETSSFNSTIEKVLTLSRTRDKAIHNAVDHQFTEIIENIKKKSSITAKVITSSGKIHQEIVAKAKEIEANIIMMGTHGVSGFDKLLLGTNAQRVVTAAQCPVITFTENPANPGLDKIILPLDLTKETREKVDAAVELAKEFNSSIDVISVLATDDDFIVNKLTRQLNQVQEYIKESKVNSRAAMLKGDNITDEIIKYSKDNKADLIMVMTQEESGLSGLFLSNTAQKIINNSAIPVFSIRPKAKKDTSVFRPY